MDRGFLNCRLCDHFVISNEEIFCFKCGNTFHSACLPITVTRADFQKMGTYNFLYYCDQCATKVKSEFKDKLAARKPTNTLDTLSGAYSYYITSNNLLASVIPQTTNDIVLAIHHGTQTDTDLPHQVNYTGAAIIDLTQSDENQTPTSNRSTPSSDKYYSDLLSDEN